MAVAATSFVDITFVGDDKIRFETLENSAGYYILEQSLDLELFDAQMIGLGSMAPVWEVDLDPVATPNEFFRVKSASIFSPLDTDGDRIDDIYEFLRPHILDPLDPSDANLDPDNNGLTHLQEYLRALFDTDSAPQFYSREVSSFNFGAPVEAAMSRELSTFNFGQASADIEAISQEYSLYNGSGPLPYAPMPLSLSPEISLFNFGSPSAPIEAISTVVSLYNGSGPPTVDYMALSLSREVTVFNFGEPTSPNEAISREVSVNALAPTE